MSNVVEFEDTCIVQNIKTDITATGEILNFREKEFISLTINRSVKLHLKWNERAGVYVGNVAGMEFQSDGPESYTYHTTRTR